MMNSLIAVLVALTYVAAAYFAWRAVQQARTAQGAMGWVIILATAPFVAVPLFLVLGQARYPEALQKRRRLRAAISELRSPVRPLVPPAEPAWGDVALRAFERLARTRFAGGNRATLLIDGAAAFPEIFSAIQKAERYVLVSTYILRDDEIGRALATWLLDRVQAGCRVCLLYDDVGCANLPAAFVEDLRAGGVSVAEFNEHGWITGWFRLNFRNHRKIVIVDGQVGFTGGLNFADEYLDGLPHLRPWRDTHIRIEGPAVADLQQAFAEDWLEETGETLELNWEPEALPDGIDALTIAPGPADRLESGSLYFCNAIQSARKRLWIASAYFVPDSDILTALKIASLGGVDVRIIVPKNADHKFVWTAAFAYFDEVRDAGVRIFQYREGFMHQKVVLIDDEIVSVGSINLDNRSCRLNFEITAVVRDTAFAGEVEAMLDADLQRSDELRTDLRSHPRPLVRYGAPFARLFAPIL